MGGSILLVICPSPSPLQELFSSPGNFHQVCQQGSCIQGCRNLHALFQGMTKERNTNDGLTKTAKTKPTSPLIRHQRLHNRGQAGLSPPTAEQLVQQDISIFIFITRKPAVNVLMDRETDQEKRQTHTEMFVCSFSNDCTVI